MRVKFHLVPSSAHPGGTHWHMEMPVVPRVGDSLVVTNADDEELDLRVHAVVWEALLLRGEHVFEGVEVVLR